MSSASDQLNQGGPLEIGDSAPLAKGPPVVTVKPASPYDGQQFLVRPDSDNFCEWEFTWNAAVGAWAFTGGPASERLSLGLVRSSLVGAWQDPGGPYLTVPFTGVYQVEVACSWFVDNTVPRNEAYAPIVVGALPPIGNYARVWMGGTYANNFAFTPLSIATGAQAGSAQLTDTAPANGVGTFNRSIRVTPMYLT